MMAADRWTQDDVAQLVGMLRDGRTAEEAATALGRTAPAIWQYMRYHRQVFQGLPERRDGARVRATKMGGGAYMRRCHDCGAPTTDYRCPACWAKLRRKGGYNLQDTVQDVESGRSTMYPDGSRI